MLLFTHPSMLAHRPPGAHAERPERLSVVLEACAPLAGEVREAPWATPEAITRVHSGSLVERLDEAFALAQGGVTAIDPDTFASSGTREAAYRAAGAVIAAVDAVLAGGARHAFCAVRPPGHHAEPERAMGFCFFNNAAIGAMHALEVHGLKRVAIADFDVHHGNGTQALAELEGRLFFASSHQSPLYPGTGGADEAGRHGNIANAPLTNGADGRAFRAAWESRLLPAIEAFAPELLIVSAGFDGHFADPLAGLALAEGDFAWIGARLGAVAERHCGGKLVSTLEGGYDLSALARSAAAFLGGLGGQ